jgi:hypothetical protein
MTELKKERFRYVKRLCTGELSEPDCPVVNGAEFEAVPGSHSDEYQVYQCKSTLHPDAPGVGRWYAICSHCRSHSHKLVEKLS